MWVMVVSVSPFQHMKGRPDVKLVANIHGNEAVTREMALHLIEVPYLVVLLTWSYFVDLSRLRVRYLCVNSVTMWVLVKKKKLGKTR